MLDDIAQGLLVLIDGSICTQGGFFATAVQATALKQRHGDFYPDLFGVAVRVDPGSKACGAIVFRDGVGVLVLGNKLNLGKLGSQLAFGRFFCQFGIIPGGQNLGVLGLCLVDPVIHVGRLRAFHGQFVFEFRECFPALTAQRFQLIAGDVILLLGDNQVHPGQVIGGLGFFHIGGGHQSHIETFLGLFQLSADGFFFGLGGNQGVPGAQDTEVALGHAQDKILSGLLEIGLGNIGAGLGFFVAVPGIHAEQRLRQLHRGGLGAEFLGDAQVLQITLCVIPAISGGDSGEQCRAALHQQLLVRVPAHAGGPPGAVIAPGGVGDLDQIGGVDGTGQ